MIRLTTNGWIFLGLMVLLYFASLTSQSSLLLFPIGILLGCYGVNAMSGWRSLQGVQLLGTGPIGMTEGESPRETWTATNLSIKRLVGLTGFLNGRMIFRIPPLGPRQQTRLQLQLGHLRRGVYPLSQIQLRSSFPFGLVRCVRRLSLGSELLVFPRLSRVAPPRANGHDAVLGGRLKGSGMARSGFDFAGVRPIEPSDSFRQVHWKASAKSEGLMVKTFQQELSGRVAVILDLFAPSLEEFEGAVREAGSLAFAALEAGDQVEWLELEVGKRLLVQPFSDGSELLERLARLEAQVRPATRADLERSVAQISRTSALHFVSAAPAGEIHPLADELKRRGRRLEVHETGAVKPAKGTEFPAGETDAKQAI